MSPPPPARKVLPGLQKLLATGCNSLVSSGLPLASQCSSETQLLASLLDSFERNICTEANGPAMGRLEMWVKNVLHSSDADSTVLEENTAILETQSRALAYLLLPYRILETFESISRSDGTFNASQYSLPKTLSKKPGSRIYNPSLSDWPGVLQAALKALKKLSHTGGLGDFKTATGGLTASLERLSKLQAHSHAMAVMQNIQSACVHIIFLLRGSTFNLCGKSTIPVPHLPGNIDDLIREMKRITGIALDRDSQARVAKLMDKTHCLQIQLLTAVFASPVFLFQSRNLSNDVWKKKELLQTALHLGNQKPLILIEVEEILWRMMFRLALSSAPLLTDIVTTLENLPWERLGPGAISLEDCSWFKCTVDVPRAPASGRPEVIDGIFRHTVVGPQPTPEAPVQSLPRTDKRKLAETNCRTAKGKRQRCTTSQAPPQQFITQSPDGIGRDHLAAEDNFTNFLSEVHARTGASVEISQNPSAATPSRPVPSHCPIEGLTVREDEVRRECSLDSATPSERVDSGGGNDILNDPVNVEYLYTYTHAPPNGGYRVQESFETVTGYHMDGGLVLFYVKYQRKEDLRLLLDLEKQVKKGWHQEEDPLYTISPMHGRPHIPSMFLDWMSFVGHEDMYSGGGQLHQRWRVLYFCEPPTKERYRIAGGFRQAIEERVLGGYINQMVLDDQSVSYDPTDPERIRAGSVELLCAEVSLPWHHRTKIYAAPPVPSAECDAYDALYCTDTVAYKATHNDSFRFHSWTSPSQALSYRTVLMQGAFEDWQMGPSGLGVSLTVELGELYVVVSDPGDGALFTTDLRTMLSSARHGALPFRTRLESIALQQGNRIVIPPCALYFIHAIEDSICHKRYFYNTVHMPLTHLALSHSLVLGRMVSREPASLEVALPILCRVVVFYYDALVRTPPIRDISDESTAFAGRQCIPEANIAYHLPDFTQTQALGEFFALINTVLLMPAYDVRMYPPSPMRRQPLVNGLSNDDATLLQHAQGRALKLKEWFSANYEILHQYLPQVIDVEELFALSLLNHANALYRYKRLVESEYPTSTTLCTAEETRNQLLQCLQPVQAEIEQVIASRGDSMPQEARAIFLSDDERKQIPKPSNPFFLSIIPTSRDIAHTVIIQSRD